MSRPTDNLVALASDLLAALATWADRDDTVPQPEVRKAGGTAVELIDQIQQALYSARNQLAGEIHESDRRTDRRIDELLASIRARREMTAATKEG